MPCPEPSVLHRFLLISLALSAITSSAAAAEPLTVAQVEKVTRLSGLSAQPSKNDKAATDFITRKDELVITFKVTTATAFNLSRSHPWLVDQVGLPGLGDEAFTSKVGRYICFKKGSMGACMTRAAALPNKPALVTEAQLLQLARVALENL
jgi:hypothetical protein